MKKVTRIVLKIVLWTIGSIVGLFLLTVILIQIPAVQNYVKDKAVNYIEGKIHTPVSIEKIEIGLPKKIILEGVYFESQQKDTLLAGEKLAVDISLFKLISNEVEINSIDLKGIVANVKRDKDSVFNFDYIIKAFASADEPKKDSKPMKFSIGKVTLDNIRVTFDDAITKNDLNVNLTHFDTRIRNFDLDKMDFEIPKITLDGLKLKLNQGALIQEIAQNTVEVADDAVQSPELKLRLDKINLSNIDIAYDNAGTKLNSGITLKKLFLEFNHIDLKKQQIELEKIEVSTIRGGLTLGKLDKKITVQTPDTLAATGPNWKVNLNKIAFKDIDFRFDDENAAKAKAGIDYKHLDLSGINLRASKIKYSSDVISGKLTKLTAKDHSGLDIEALRTDFYYGSKNAYLKNLYVKTPQTLIKDEINVGYSSIASISKNLGALAINANINGSQIGFKDILIFVPTLSKTNPFLSNPNAILHINSKVSGKVNDLTIPNLEISGIGSTVIAASGRITGLPDVNKAYFDLNIKNFQSTAKDINLFVPKGTIPSNIQLPSQLKLTGTFKGGITNFNTNLNLVSSFGNARIKALFDQRKKKRERYDANVELTNFNVGRLLKNDSIGKISLKAAVKGTGLDPKTASATLNGLLIKADYNRYTYRNLALKGIIKNGLFNAEAGMNDPNLDFKLVASGNFNKKYPSVKADLAIEMADLNKINLSKDPLRVSGKLNADIEDADPDFLNGTISLDNFIIANAKEQFILDTIHLVATATADTNTIKLKSQFIDADVVGKYKLTQLATALQQSIAKYYNTNPGVPPKKIEPQHFAFNLKVKNDPALLALVPEIKRLDPITLNGRYNSVNDSIVLNGTIPKVIYGANTITNGIIALRTEDGALNYSLVIDDIQSSQINLPYTSITGTVKENTVAYKLQVRDTKDKEHYLVEGKLKAENGDTEISLDPQGLVLNYETWNIAPENSIRLGKNGIHANDFELRHDGNILKIQSESDAPNAPLAVDFTDFKIETVTSMIQKDTLLVGGVINGNVLIRDLAKTPVFTSDLKITDLSFKSDTIGNLEIKVDNEIANTFRAAVQITGQENQVNLDGTYRTDNSSFDMNLDMQRLNLKSIQGFTMGAITESTGFLSGQFKVDGTANQPNVIGDLKFNAIGFRVQQLNSVFKDMNESIAFTPSGIVFNNFSLKDEEDNVLAVNGRINTTTYRDFGFDMKVDADNFRAMNSTEKDNDLYYGELYLDTHLNIKGTLESPVVDGNIKINEGTKLTVVMPQSDPSIADREGIVEFIDQDNPQLKKMIIADESVSKSKLTGMNVSVNIAIVKEAELNLVIDKGNGDFLKLKGEAELNGGIDPSGKTSLTGRYEFTEGAYEMSFNFIKRKFDIEKGSYILWTGEPMSANINITAIYEIETAPIDLVDDQLGSVAPAVRNTYKQKIPFQTKLMMQGELLKPQISFDIQIPDGNYNVSADVISLSKAKLDQIRNQPSEMNKQVFALLLLNRFVGENPFASEAGSVGAESIARQSVSKILSQQLNNLAGDLIQGVEVNFDLESTDDYTTGQRENRTDLNVAVSKKLLNDRLKVTIGSNFGLEGPDQENREANNIAGDISADYQLTKDGRYMVRAYRKNQYQVALQGQVVETGVAFIITMDYNKFRELFHRSQKDKEIKEKEKKDKEKNAATKKEKNDSK